MKIKEFSKKVNMSERKVKEMIKTGKLKAQKEGRAWNISDESIIDFISDGNEKYLDNFSNEIIKKYVLKNEKDANTVIKGYNGYHKGYCYPSKHCEMCPYFTEDIYGYIACYKDNYETCDKKEYWED